MSARPPPGADVTGKVELIGPGPADRQPLSNRAAGR